MSRITEAQLKHLVSIINRLTGNVDEPYTDRKANIGNYHLSYAYGGVCLHQMVNEGGGIRTVLMDGYVTKRELYDAMSAFIDGLEAGKQLSKE